MNNSFADDAMHASSIWAMLMAPSRGHRAEADMRIWIIELSNLRRLRYPQVVVHSMGNTC